MNSFRPVTLLILAAVPVAIAAIGCDKKPEDGTKPSASAAATTAASAMAKTSAAAATTSAAAPQPASTLPAKPPFEALKITYTGEKDGEAVFKIENVGGKTVKSAFLDFWGYDEKGNQVLYKDLSWNIELKGGASAETTKKADPKVKTWEVTYHGITFEGEPMVNDSKRSPSKRPKGGPP